MKKDTTVFRGLTAGEALQRNAVVLRAEMPLRRAADLLHQRRLRAAPVADQLGRCVGVLTVMDILRWTLDERRARLNGVGQTDQVWCDWQMVDGGGAQRDRVVDYMTRDPLLVTRDTRLAKVSKNFLLPKRRPMVVVDGQQRPIGMLSSNDVLAALAAVHQENGGEHTRAEVSKRNVLLPA